MNVDLPATECARKIADPAEEFNNEDGVSFEDLSAGCCDLQGQNSHVVLICTPLQDVSWTSSPGNA